MSHQHHHQHKNEIECCNVEEKINTRTNIQTSQHDHNHDHDHSVSGKSWFVMFRPSIISFAILLMALILDHFIKPEWYNVYIRLTIYLLAYMPVGFPVIKEAWESIRKGDIFSEFFLMVVATMGAFAIGEYPEAVTVMLFYSLGEVFQTMAVSKAKSDIKNLLDERPDEVTIVNRNQLQKIKAEEVEIGSIIQLKAGEKLALDGELLSEKAVFNTAALTGESKPDTKNRGETVYAGMIVLNSPAQVKVRTAYSDSKLSKILHLVQEATTKKAPTELFIRKFARIYTPIVVFSAIAICFLPFFFIKEYHFQDWLYRSLIFLVVSCPCALVISIPLGYFGGIGAGSRNGILFKGSNYLDMLAKVNHLVTDKTGTLTKGVFEVQKIVFNADYQQDEILKLVNVLETHSSHPVATAIHQYVGAIDTTIKLTAIEEISGHGLKADYEGKILLAGNFKLLEKFKIPYNFEENNDTYTIIAIAFDGKYVGYIAVADEIKEESKTAINNLQKLKVQITMLSGDKSSVVAYVAKQLGIQYFYGGLLPENKVEKVQALKSKNEVVAFVGDGVNDAPVVAISDVGIAMGGLGSDATIETADVVIQDDNPNKIPMAIRIGQQTKRIVWQNISFAFGVKLLVLILGAGGLATMWEAVFADVGVALLAILNAVRIQRMNFNV